ncbi:conserved protein of unknown function [Oenococcus oeni]|uniref:helix-turn-helix domain-containing protein n=1 Tax=Oenococcus oeni TaxID=1247 RepID=UPI00107C1136|nr:helix-turn-helix domain-containing protein [Oenococcus oeni]AVI94076.1 hypothetical protein AX764_04180 [Oenococcus oeni]SYV99732.1 conserved hypothetical protein [Oenococcus oeni]SYW03921.1 conserved hypothetical protein [Oenococcus oeni]SYW17686.1 conserved hypothetical protein [Oenococcus oeni]VDC14589.1 conserved protein of unknown function [Oenococcus oeni]
MEETFFMTRKEIAKTVPCSPNFFDQHIRYTQDFKDIVSEKRIGDKLLFPRKQVEEYLESL